MKSILKNPCVSQIIKGSYCSYECIKARAFNILDNKEYLLVCREIQQKVGDSPIIRAPPKELYKYMGGPF
jgi:hypothetical protein